MGLNNYIWAINNPESKRAVLNNLGWLLIVPTLSTFFGLVIANLADRIWWGTIAKSIIFMPMAISFVGAGVIWKFVYDYRGPGDQQIGFLNAIIVSLGYEPQAWITIPIWNNVFLMAIMIWIQTGLAMVIFSAALRSVPKEMLEAARMDGASELRIFTSIILLVATFSYLVYANVDYFLYFIIFLGIFCCCEWIVTNSLLLKKFNKSFLKYFSIYLFGFIYFILIVPLSAFYLRVEVSLNFFLLILIICIFLISVDMFLAKL